MAQVRPDKIEMRPPEQVMRLARLGSMHQCRLSFMRVLPRRMAREGWQFSSSVFEFDAAGVGHAVYTAKGPERSYSLIAFGHDLPPEQRSDRVIATAWDATFTLFDGVPTKADIERLAQNIPLQEAGRVTETEISVSRANRSVRLWAHCVGALANGHQPDLSQIEAVGYLMRTTAVYGSGKLGASDYEAIASRPEMGVPFQAEMLSVFLTRTFVRDLVNHIARAKGGERAVEMAAPIARRLGIGNSTGLGLAPYIVNHPVLFNNWIEAREAAIARVRALETASKEEVTLFRDLLERSAISVANWSSEHPIQIRKLDDLGKDMVALAAYVATDDLRNNFPWNRLVLWSESALGVEGQELLASLILEPYSGIVDGLAPGMADTNTDAFYIDGSMTVAETRALLAASFGWAFGLDWSARENCARAWYVSEEKLEPRLGERFEEPVAAYEQPLAPARDATRADAALEEWQGDAPIAEFLLRHPEHRHTIRRAQISRGAPYGEIRDNTISATVLPIDFLRVKLAFFSATHFNPRSDRWVRICMFANAPYPEDLSVDNADFWAYPEGAA